MMDGLLWYGVLLFGAGEVDSLKYFHPLADH